MEFDPDDTRMLANLLIACFLSCYYKFKKTTLSGIFGCFQISVRLDFKFLIFQLWNHNKIKTIAKSTGLYITIFLSLTLKSLGSFSSKKSLGSSYIISNLRGREI